MFYKNNIYTQFLRPFRKCITCFNLRMWVTITATGGPYKSIAWKNQRWNQTGTAMTTSGQMQMLFFVKSGKPV